MTLKSVSWTAPLPPSTELAVEIRTGDTPKPDRTWSAWSAVGNGAVVVTPPARYLQYRVRLLTAASSLNSVPLNITITSNASNVSPTPFGPTHSPGDATAIRDGEHPA